MVGNNTNNSGEQQLWTSENEYRDEISGENLKISVEQVDKKNN